MWLKLGVASLFVMLGVSSAWALRPPLDSVDNILQAREQAGAQEREMAARGKAIGRDMAERKASASVQFKLWCGVALFFPEAESLVQCAYFNIESVKEMSNPSRPAAEICAARAREGLVLLQAAERLLQEGGVSEGLAERIGRDRARYQEIIDKPEGACG